MAVIDVDHHAIRIEHRSDRASDGETVHPVERRCERHDAKQTQVCGKTLSSHVDPPGVREPSFGREASSFLDHLVVGVDADDFFEQVSDPEGNRARPQPTSSRRPVPASPNASWNASARHGEFGSRPRS